MHVLGMSLARDICWHGVTGTLVIDVVSFSNSGAALSSQEEHDGVYHPPTEILVCKYLGKWRDEAAALDNGIQSSSSDRNRRVQQHTAHQRS